MITHTMPDIKHNKTKNITLKKCLKRTVEKQFYNWIHQFVKFDPSKTTRFSDAYNNYCEFIQKTYQAIPLSKNQFSRFLRERFKNEEKEKKFFFIPDRPYLLKEL